MREKIIIFSVIGVIIFSVIGIISELENVEPIENNNDSEIFSQEELSKEKRVEKKDEIKLVFSNSFGKFGIEQGEFNAPHSIDFFDDKIFVLDAENNRIQVFLTDGSFHSKIPVEPNAHGIAVSEDKIFIAETYKYRVSTYTHDGKIINQFPITFSRDLEADSEFLYILEPHQKQVSVYNHDGEFNFALPVHENVHYLNSDNDKIVVSGPHPSIAMTPEIIIINKKDGTVESRFNTSQNARGSDIYQEKVFLVEGDQIKILNMKGEVLAEIGSTGKGNGEFSLPTQIEFDNNFVYVLDHQNHRIQILSVIYE
jgi:DNA-binding beta-propeller fold protein YncE